MRFKNYIYSSVMYYINIWYEFQEQIHFLNLNLQGKLDLNN